MLWRSIAEAAASERNAQTILTPAGETKPHSHSDLGKKSKPPTSSSNIRTTGSGNWRNEAFKQAGRNLPQPDVAKPANWRDGVDTPSKKTPGKAKPSKAGAAVAFIALVLAIVGGLGGLTFLQKNALEGEVDTHLKAKDVDAAFHAIDNAGIFASFFKDGAKTRVREHLMERAKESANTKKWPDFLETTDSIAKHFGKDSEFQTLLKDTSEKLLAHSLAEKSFPLLLDSSPRLPFTSAS